jgi:hypothetical protein
MINIYLHLLKIRDKENFIFQKDLLINEFLDYPEIGVMLYYYAELYCYPEPITLEKFLHFSKNQFRNSINK